MAVLKYTASELLTTIRNRGSLPPTDQIGASDPDLLRYAAEEMMNELVPDVMKVKEEYFVVSRRYTLTSSRFRIPARAIGQKLRQALWVDGSGYRRPLERITIDDITAFEPASVAEPKFYYIENNHLMLVPVGFSPTGGQLEVSFFFQPGQIVLESAVRKVKTIASGVITLDSAAPATFLTTALYDVHSPHSGAEVKAFDLAPSTISGDQMVFATADVDGSQWGTLPVEVGDYVCLAGEAALPGLPRELHPILAQAVVCRAHEALGNMEAVEMHTKQLNRMLVNAGYLVETRVEGKPLKVLNNSGWSLYGGSRVYF